jgi:hypothetical protein
MMDERERKKKKEKEKKKDRNKINRQTYTLLVSEKSNLYTVLKNTDTKPRQDSGCRANDLKKKGARDVFFCIFVFGLFFLT